jgi:hypothetical protein
MTRSETLLIGDADSYVLPLADVATHTTTSKVDGVPIGTGGLHQYSGLSNSAFVAFVMAGASPASTDEVAGQIPAINSTTGSVPGRTEIDLAVTDARTIKWLTPSETLTGTVWWPALGSDPDADAQAIEGAIAFEATIGGKHTYSWAYDADDRPSAPTTGIVTITDGTETLAFDVDFALLNVPSAVEVRQEMDSNSTQLAVAAAGAAGTVGVTDNEDGTLTLSFKGADGTTEVANVTYTTETGARTRNS